MKKLVLAQEWHVGERIGDPSGFGRVHAGESPSGDSVAIKFIPKVPGAERELLFEDLSGTPNIVPILDSGETPSEYVLVMPLADRSLRALLDSAGAPPPLDEAISVLKDVATALVALDGRAVHRDIKPANILFYNGHWCLADFGIARYAEATTDTNTHKFAMTPPYAAPEQWRLERATSATDIYALGCVAYEMFAGAPPFAGPDYRSAHLREVPSPLSSTCPTALASIVMQCLLKAPGSRPTAGVLMERLAKLDPEPPSDAARRLQEANQIATERAARASAHASAQQSEAERRNELLGAAKTTITPILNSLREEIIRNAPQVRNAPQAQTQPRIVGILLNNANLVVSPISSTLLVLDGPLRHHSYELFDVIAYADISLRIPPDQYHYEGRSHSLWYCDAESAGVYRWYETAFMFSPLIARQGRQDPFSLPPTEGKALGALTPVIDELQVAWPFIAFDQGEEQEFIDRWIGWFADAAQGKLMHPRSMPERPIRNTWRCRPA